MPIPAEELDECDILFVDDEVFTYLGTAGNVFWHCNTAAMRKHRTHHGRIFRRVQPEQKTTNAPKELRPHRVNIFTSKIKRRC